MTDSPAVGFIGTGNMGGPMAARLLQSGLELVVYNRSPAKLRELEQAGAVPARSPAALAAQADIVCLCLTDGTAVEQVVFAAAGVAEAIRRDAVLVDFSSISPQQTVALAGRLRDSAGAAWVDAPVSGGVPGAREGRLVIMCGADDETQLRALEPVFNTVAARVTHTGPVGSGQITKLCNQVIVSCNLAVIAEAINLARRAGIDAARLPDALAGGFADSLPLQIYGPRMAIAAERAPLGAIGTMLKDMRNAMDVAAGTQAPLPMTTRAEQIYAGLAGAGFSEQDLEALMQQFDMPAQL